MRIALVIYRDLETLSGGFLYDRLLVDALRDRGHQVDVITLPWHGYLRLITQNFSPDLFDQLGDPGYNIILQDELNHPSLFWLNRRLKSRLKSPLVSIVHSLRSSEPRSPLMMPVYRLIEGAYLNTLDAIIVNSRTTLGAVNALLDNPIPTCVGYPAGDRFQTAMTVKEVTDRVQQTRPLQIVFLGNVIVRKGLHTLLDALARLPSESARLTVIGSLDFEPRYVRRIKKQVRRLGLTAQVTFTGPLGWDQQETLIGHLKQSDVLAVPSTYEAFGIVYLEAMAFGLPVIATTGGAAHEIIGESNSGFLIPPEDDGELAARLYELHDNPDRLQAMSLAALGRFKQHPTWDDTIAAIVSFLKDIVNG